MLRAVIYARCSTEEDSQIDALKKQVEEAKFCVQENNWILMDSYVESRSGTTTKGRTEYNRLYEDLLCDKFDIIVIKSQDRLMRNTKDWYLFVDRMSTEQKRLYMYIERKFYTPDDALITGIKAILAEEYSRELSKKINNSHRNRQKNNGTVILTSNTYGYRKLPDKSIVLDEEEAKIKRRMYELCAAGFGSRTISTILQNDGIYNRNGKPFTDSAILRILRNPLNKGTVVMNRKHFDFETKKTIKMPEEEQFVYENKVPRTVSDELWELANREIDKRAVRVNGKNGEKRGKYQGKSHLSGKIYCGLCGMPYYRRTRKRYKDGKILYEWKCKRYLETGRNHGVSDRPQLRKVGLENIEGCDNVHLDEETLYQFLEQVCKEYYQIDRDQIIRDMIRMLRYSLKDKDYEPEIERANKKRDKLREQMSRLIDKLLEGVISDEIYRRKQSELEKEQEELHDKLLDLEEKKAKGNVVEERLRNIEKVLLDGQTVEKATVAGMLEDIENIFIYPEHMELEFSLFNAIGVEILEVPAEIGKKTIRIEYGSFFNYNEKKKDDREQVVDMIRENPNITAKMIAARLGCSLSGANYKLKALKKEGRIRFAGKGGKGKWEILKE